MSANINIETPIFEVQYMSRKEINLYVFIGDTDNVISKILNKIEAIEKLTPEDLKLLKSLYKNSYLRWISKSKINPIKFINYKIELEDCMLDAEVMSEDFQH